MLNVLFTGDVCFKLQQEVDFAAAQSILADVKPALDSADLVIMNLETPLADEGVGAPIRKSGPNIIGRPQNIGFLEAAGCDAVSLANNHTGDYGDAALFATLRLLDAHGIGYAGAGANLDEAYRAWRCEKSGVKLSLLAVCEHEFGLASETSAGTAALNMARLADAIELERTVSDFVVVFAHGGCEFCPVPSPKTMERYRTMVHLGADAIIGAHSHCPQGWEFYRGKPIVYGLGNFLFKHEPNVAPSWFFGYMAELTLAPKKPPVLTVKPYRFEPDGSKVELLRGDALAAMRAYLDELTAIVADHDRLRAYYAGWCAHRGLSYINGLRWDPDWVNESPADMGGFANLLACESHIDMLAETAGMVFDGRIREAAAHTADVLRLQKL